MRVFDENGNLFGLDFGSTMALVFFFSIMFAVCFVMFSKDKTKCMS